MTNSHIAKAIQHREMQTDSTLHVIGVITNPVQWHSRIRLFKEWRDRMLKYPNVKLYVVEGVFGDRKPECAPAADEYSYMSVRIDSEIWIKENLINIGVGNLFPANWKYMAWVDCDVKFYDDNWALSAIHQLQHYNIIQPWSQCIDLDFHGGISQVFNSFGFLNANGKPMWHGNKGPYSYAHTGFAWACNRYFWENTGGLIDWCIIGSGDHHCAWGCLGQIIDTIHTEINDEYKKAADIWQQRAKWASGGIVGYLHGRIEHYFHGHKIDRQYWNRWQIILKCDFNPFTDIAKDSQGVIRYVGKAANELEQLVMRYNRDRREDAT